MPSGPTRRRGVSYSRKGLLFAGALQLGNDVRDRLLGDLVVLAGRPNSGFTHHVLAQGFSKALRVKIAIAVSCYPGVEPLQRHATGIGDLLDETIARRPTPGAAELADCGTETQEIPLVRIQNDGRVRGWFAPSAPIASGQGRTQLLKKPGRTPPIVEIVAAS